MNWASREDLFGLLARALPQLQAYREVVTRASGHGTRVQQAKIERRLAALELLISDIEQLPLPTPTGRPPGIHTPWKNKDRYSSDH